VKESYPSPSTSSRISKKKETEMKFISLRGIYVVHFLLVNELLMERMNDYPNQLFVTHDDLQFHLDFLLFEKQNYLLDCWDGGFRVSGGGTKVVKSNSFSSLFIGFNDGGDRSISLTCRGCSSAVIGRREIVTLICPGWISRRTASCRIAAASKFDILINFESLITSS
jgi:hypothetical protein